MRRLVRSSSNDRYKQVVERAKKKFGMCRERDSYQAPNQFRRRASSRGGESIDRRSPCDVSPFSDRHREAISTVETVRSR
ncbi:hypothetical protein GWI33_020963 [Rhynchophorus ferrugineus]|uniref:Uncharacterized protein n=1 Tax=Rhynchophorus ferrugineus TaxID=354439 RepID=A0A834HVK4_RHYFE|nr:hypothetical protein GWI33_020963 [Rhynchophorus ferrugineus]